MLDLKISTSIRSDAKESYLYLDVESRFIYSHL